MLASGGGDAARLAAVLRRSPLLTEALQVARGVDAPDWLVNAGAIRDAVWDAAHGLPTAAPLRAAAGSGEALGRPLAANALRRTGRAVRVSPRATGEQSFDL